MSLLIAEAPREEDDRRGRRLAHPLTDEQITKKLDDEGIHVTRRTVAKYREDLRIPSTHHRRVKVKAAAPP